MQDADDLKLKLYDLFFSWSRDQHDPDGANKGKKQKMLSVCEEYSDIKKATSLTIEE